jgi:hypothetical protein
MQTTLHFFRASRPPTEMTRSRSSCIVFKFYFHVKEKPRRGPYAQPNTTVPHDLDFTIPVRIPRPNQLIRPLPIISIPSRPRPPTRRRPGHRPLPPPGCSSLPSAIAPLPTSRHFPPQSRSPFTLSGRNLLPERHKLREDCGGTKPRLVGDGRCNDMNMCIQFFPNCRVNFFG